MRRKNPGEHLVPLSTQAAALLRELRTITGSNPHDLLFPGLVRGKRISENTLNQALRRMGYGPDKIVSHGFRAMASTQLNEQGHAPDLIELQLAHCDSSVRAIYNRATRLSERRAMMQSWSDYLVRLKEGAVSSWARAHPATVAPAGSNRSSRGGNKAAEASGVEGHESDLASTQAVT